MAKGKLVRISHKEYEEATIEIENILYAETLAEMVQDLFDGGWVRHRRERKVTWLLAVPEDESTTRLSKTGKLVAAREDKLEYSEAAPAKRIDGMKDFFISYNSAERDWAEWIAWTLEKAGYSAVIQAWDFRPGGDFILEMHKAATGTEKTIIVLSNAYLGAEYTQPEWSTAFVSDPRGDARTLIPLRVEECSPRGLLKTRIYADLVGLPPGEAKAVLLAALKDRDKPDQPPVFPGPLR